MIQDEDRPRLSFGIIVLNGEPFTKYCLRAIYPFAREIIVVEGACEAARQIATSNGHSTDATMQSLNEFKREEDPANKLRIITRDGFWPEKDDQSRAYAEAATGDYLWQVDIDEFYKKHDMEYVIRMLKNDPSITAVSFKQIQFWGGFSYYADGWYLRRGVENFHRVFKWSKNYSYVTHRPPTVLNDQMTDTRNIKWVNARETASKGIYLYHYSLVFPKQVREKCEYYSKAEWAGRSEANDWADRVFMRLEKPYRVHNVYNHPGWLERFNGDHPERINEMIADIRSGKVAIDLRPTDDIEKILNSKLYMLGRAGLKILEPLDRMWGRGARVWCGRFRRMFTDPVGLSKGALRKIKGSHWFD